jgi:hypothetical protein
MDTNTCYVAFWPVIATKMCFVILFAIVIAARALILLLLLLLLKLSHHCRAIPLYSVLLRYHLVVCTTSCFVV